MYLVNPVNLVNPVKNLSSIVRTSEPAYAATCFIGVPDTKADAEHSGKRLETMMEICEFFRGEREG